MPRAINHRPRRSTTFSPHLQPTPSPHHNGSPSKIWSCAPREYGLTRAHKHIIRHQKPTRESTNPSSFAEIRRSDRLQKRQSEKNSARTRRKTPPANPRSTISKTKTRTKTRPSLRSLTPVTRLTAQSPPPQSTSRSHRTLLSQPKPLPRTRTRTQPPTPHRER